MSQEIDAWIRALKDSSGETRVHAVEALVQIGPLAVEPLCKVVRFGDGKGRNEAAEALAQIGVPAVESLCRALKDNRLDVRMLAVKALGRSGDPRAIEPLCQMIGQKGTGFSETVATALAQFGIPAVEPLCRVLKDSGEHAFLRASVALEQIGIIAVEPLCSVLTDSRPRVRYRAAEVLGQIGDASAVAPLCRALGDETDYIRSQVAHALGRIGDPNAVEPLCRALRDKVGPVREAVAFALGHIGDRDTLPRKILLSATMSVSAKAGALQALRNRKARCLVRIHDRTFSQRYELPSIRQFCQQRTLDTDAQVREAATDLLGFLAGDILLRPSQRDTPAERDQLLRGATPEPNCHLGTELLRASDVPVSPLPKLSGLWKRLRQPWNRTRPNADGPEE